MPRIARVVVPGVPHHIIQRGNRRQRTFFCDADFRAYRTLLGRFCQHYGLEIWCHCLMPNHSHLVAMPRDASSLRRSVGRTHEAYTRMVNKRFGWKGCLWQGRFRSFPMDERYLLDAARYVLLNPVKAGLVRSPLDWPWSSARAHVGGESDGLTNLEPLAARVDDWDAFLRWCEGDTKLVEQFQKHSRTGRPLGSDDFIRDLERRTGRRLAPRRAGRRLGRSAEK